MRMTFYDWLLTFLIGIMLYDSIKSEKPLNCGNQPINAWMIGIIAVTFIARIVFHIYNMASILPSFLVTISNIILLGLFLFTPIWNVLGTIWVTINATIGNRCLKPAALAIVLLIQLVIYVTLGVFYYLLYKFTMLYYKNQWEKESVIKKLDKLYTNNNEVKKLDLQQFTTKHRVILQSTPLLDLERNIIKDLCSYTASGASVDLECGICLNRIIENELVSRIQCDHVFHYDCLIGWFGVKPLCPFCRKPFREDLLRLYCDSILHKDDENRGLRVN